MEEIYLDANATTPVLPAARAAALAAMSEDFGNPSSVHSTGLKARAMMDAVRERARRVLNAPDGRLLFMSGATEGIQTAVLSALTALRGRLGVDYLLYGATEHKAVPEALKHWNALLGLQLQVLAIPVDVHGRHDLDWLRAHAPRAGLVCTMAANNETGVVSDLDGIAAVLNACETRPFWMVDGVQALGKLPLQLRERGIDYAPFSGHKLYAPKGIGMLYVREGAPFTPLMAGGGQEGALRSGTENMSGIAALGAVLAALEEGQSFRDHAMLARFRDALALALQEAFPGLVFNVPLALSLPTTLNFAVPGLSSRLLQDLFDAAEVRVSGGSACSAAKAQPSFVLQAMGLPDWQAAGAVRLSIGPAADANFIAEACARIRACGESLRQSCLSPAENLPLPDDGITRFAQDGACCYLIADREARACVLIDPLPEQVSRLAQRLRCQDFALRAVISSSGEPAHAEARELLAAELGLSLPAADARGWPLDTPVLALGQRRLERRGQSLLLDGQIAFGAAADPACGARFIAPAFDAEQQIVLGCAPATACDAGQLDGRALQDFVERQPEALLVDVREPYEQFLSRTPELAGARWEAVPLSRLLNALPEWLAQPRPLLFVCRSGNRSRQAALALARLGHAQSYTLAGGLALLPATAKTGSATSIDPAFHV